MERNPLLVVALGGNAALLKRSEPRWKRISSARERRSMAAGTIAGSLNGGSGAWCCNRCTATSPQSQGLLARRTAPLRRN